MVIRTEENLPLDAPERVVVFHDQGQPYRHVFRRLTQADWEQYFSLLVIEREDRAGGQQIRRLDDRTAALELHGRALGRAEGYRVKGGAALEALLNWKERLPYAHRLKAVDLLTRVNRSESEAVVEIDPELETVYLDATWSEGEPGHMQQFQGLAHRFRQPMAEHWKRYNRNITHTIVVGGSRSGRTIYPISQRFLLQLYDELIAGVSGYSVGGQALSDRNQVIAEMDAFHKVAAIGQVFRAVVDDEAPRTE